MKYTLSDMVLERAEKNVGKNVVEKVIKKIKLLPDYSLENVASDLKLQAFDAAYLIKTVRKDSENIPTSSIFESSAILSKIKLDYNLQDIDDCYLDNETLAGVYVERIRLMIGVVGRMFVDGITETTGYAIRYLMKSFIGFLSVISNIFVNLKSFVLEIINSILLLPYGEMF